MRRTPIGKNNLTVLNPSDKTWSRKAFILWFGACAPTNILVYAHSLDAALDECVDYLTEHAPGLLADDDVLEEYERALSEFLADDTPEDKARELAADEALTDVTILDGDHYLHSDEWGIQIEDPLPSEIAAFYHRR